MRAFSIQAKSPVERGVRAVAMVCVILVVMWAFWKNNQRVVAQMQQGQAYWDETGKSKQYIKSFARDFSKSMEDDFGIKARIQIRDGELEEPNPQEDMLLLVISPSARQVKLRIVPTVDADRKLIQAIEQGHFDEYWDSGWEAGLQSALVLIWNHYSGETTGFMDLVTESESAFDASAPAPVVVDETGELSEKELAFVTRFAAGLEREFGQGASVHIFAHEVRMPEKISGIVFIGISPSRKEALVSLPPLIQRVLPAGFEGQLMGEHFPQYFASGDWPLGLKTALIKIWKGLAGEDEIME